MNDLLILTTLLSLGLCGSLLFFRSGDIGIWLMRTFKFGWANNPLYHFSGWANGLGVRGEGETTTADPVKFTPEQQKAVDHIIQERLVREKQKYGDYEDLKKFKTEFEKTQDQKAQEELVRQKKYEESEAVYKKQLGEVQNVVAAKDGEIRNLKINHVLSNEIAKSNGYIEESVALLLRDADLDKSGNVIIKGKDANGLDVLLSAGDGVKRFLETRPHLVKSTHQKGGGSGSGDNGSGAGGSAGSGKGEDHVTLNADLKRAIDVGDRKKANEIKTKLNALGFVRR